ncbi:MAG: response regulator transcription factor [Candidatus Acidiferrales bacterium]
MLPSRQRSNPIRVGVADANLMACNLISSRLKNRFDVLGHATSGSDLLRMMHTATPQVVLIGCHLGDGNLSGLFVLPEIQSQHPEIRVVLLIDRSEREVVVQAFRTGAMGVFDRSEFHFDHLCKCIVCVHHGQIWANTQQLKFVLEAVAHSPSPRVVDADGVSLLTKREEDLVRLVADGLGNREIARKLSLSEHTVKNYMFRIFDKLGISNRVELVLYALNNPKRPLLSNAGKESSGIGSQVQGNRFCSEDRRATEV